MLAQYGLAYCSGLGELCSLRVQLVSIQHLMQYAHVLMLYVCLKGYVSTVLPSDASAFTHALLARCSAVSTTLFVLGFSLLAASFSVLCQGSGTACCVPPLAHAPA